MRDVCSPPVDIARCGPIARRTLMRDGDARVIATVSRGLYVTLDDRDLICIGAGNLGDGPINVELANASGGLLDVIPGTTGRIDSGLLRLGSRFTMRTRSGETWTPPLLPLFHARTLAQSLARLHTMTSRRRPTDGLAPLVLGVPDESPPNPLLRAAAAPVADLRHGLAMALTSGSWPAPGRASALRLVGLGPGLTPSGDDLLGGMLLAFSATGRTDIRQALWHTIAPHVDALTSPISAAFLRAAAEGLAARPLHDMLAMLLQGDGDRLTEALDAVSKIGHTSGWDALSGVVLALRALVAHAGDRAPQEGRIGRDGPEGSRATW